jgi:hypothetical protein
VISARIASSSRLFRPIVISERWTKGEKGRTCGHDRTEDGNEVMHNGDGVVIRI